jgi:hypothetical protein
MFYQITVPRFGSVQGFPRTLAIGNVYGHHCGR